MPEDWNSSNHMKSLYIIKTEGRPESPTIRILNLRMQSTYTKVNLLDRELSRTIRDALGLRQGKKSLTLLS